MGNVYCRKLGYGTVVTFVGQDTIKVLFEGEKAARAMDRRRFNISLPREGADVAVKGGAR